MSIPKGKFDLEKIRKLIVAISLLTISIFLIILTVRGTEGVFSYEDSERSVTLQIGDTIKGAEAISQISKEDLERIDSEEVDKLEGAVIKEKTKVEKDISILELYLKETNLSEELYTKNDSLLQRRNREKRKAEKLIKNLKAFKTLPTKNKRGLLTDISNFIVSIADTPNSNKKQEINKIVTAILTENKTLKKELATLKRSNQKLRTSLSKFKDIEKELFAIQQKYFQAIDQINKLEIALKDEEREEKDLLQQMTSLEALADNLKQRLVIQRKAINSLEDEINSSIKVRVSALEFEPTNARKKTNGDYALWQVNRMRLQFKLVSNSQNYDRYKKHDVTIKVYQPNPNPRLNKAPLLQTLQLSIPIGVPYDNEFTVGQDGKKGKGLYLVEISINNNEEEHLLDWATFTTRKYLRSKDIKS